MWDIKSWKKKSTFPLSLILKVCTRKQIQATVAIDEFSTEGALTGNIKINPTCSSLFYSFVYKLSSFEKLKTGVISFVSCVVAIYCGMLLYSNSNNILYLFTVSS